MTNMVDRLRNVIIGCKESQLGKTDHVVNLRMRQLLFFWSLSLTMVRV